MAIGGMQKAIIVIILSILLIIVFNQLFSSQFGEWSISIAAGVTMLAMWPVMNYFAREGRIAGVIFKLDSKMGLNLIDRLGTGYATFWKFIGDLATVLLFGGLGTAFIAHHSSEKQRKYLLALLVFGVLYVFLSQTAVSIYPTVFIFNFSLLALGLAAIAAFVTFKISHRLSKGKATIIAFILAFLFFAYPFLLSYEITGSTISLVSAFFMGIVGLPGYLILLLAASGLSFMFGSAEVSAIYPTLPAIENGTPVLKDPGGLGISIPIFPDLLFAFLVLLVLHEGFHGLVARAQNIRVKHTGLATLSVMPLGAFVEPDEDQFKKEGELKQVRVFAVGSFANIFVLAVLALLLGNLMLSQGWVYSEGMYVGTVVQNSPASQFIAVNDLIYEIDGRQMGSKADFYEEMYSKIPNQSIIITTSQGTFQTNLASNPRNKSVGYLGVGPSEGDRTLAFFAPDMGSSKLAGAEALVFFNLLKWIFIINLSVGLFNLLPLPIFDGHGVYRNIFKWIEKTTKKKNLARVLTNGFTFLILLILFINIFPYFL